MKYIFAIILVSLLSCQKSNLNLRILAPGTTCTIKAGVFASTDKQPAQPVIVGTVFSQNNAIIFYNVTDTQGVVWQLPDSDLVVMK